MSIWNVGYWMAENEAESNARLHKRGMRTEVKMEYQVWTVVEGEKQCQRMFPRRDDRDAQAAQEAKNLSRTGFKWSVFTRDVDILDGAIGWFSYGKGADLYATSK